MYDKIIKITLFGGTNTGKTSLIKRYVENRYSDYEKLTIGTDFFKYLFDSFGKKIDITIFDTAGGERYRSLTKQHISGNDIIILVYSVDNRNSFEEIKNYWFLRAKKVRGKNGKEDGK